MVESKKECSSVFIYGMFVSISSCCYLSAHYTIVYVLNFFIIFYFILPGFALITSCVCNGQDCGPGRQEEVSSVWLSVAVCLFFLFILFVLLCFLYFDSCIAFCIESFRKVCNCCFAMREISCCWLAQRRTTFLQAFFAYYCTVKCDN